MKRKKAQEIAKLFMVLADYYDIDVDNEPYFTSFVSWMITCIKLFKQKKYESPRK